MKNRIIYLSYLIILIPIINFAQGNWKTLKTGAGGWITGMHVNASGAPIFARSDVGSAYRFDSNNQTWTNIVSADNLPASELGWEKYGGVLSLVSASSNPNVAYLAYYDGIYRSSNQGDTWVKTNFPSTPMPANDDESKTYGERLAVDPIDENIVYFGSINDGLWRSLDGGNSWTKVTAVPNGQTDRGVRSIIFDSTAGSINDQTKRIFVLVDGEDVYLSENAGSSWTATNFSFQNPHFYDAEISTDGKLYVCGQTNDGTPLGVLRFSNSTWTSVFNQNQTMGEIAVDPFDSDRVFIFSEGFTDIYRSLNANNNQPTWTYVTRDLVANNIPWMEWTSADWFVLGEVVFDPVTQGKIWVSDGIGTWNSVDLDDNIMTWNEISTGQEHLVSNDLVVANGKAITAHWDRPLYLHDDDDTYPTIHQPSSRFNSSWDLDLSPSDPNFVVAVIEDHRFCCYDENSRSSGYSEDGGQTWTKFATMPEPGNSNLIFGVIAVAANDNDNIVWLPAGNRMPYYTTDRGNTWTQATLPSSSGNCCIDGHYFKRKILVADRVLNNCFYIYDWGDGSIFKTTDGGATWTKSSNTGLTSYAYNGKMLSVPGQAGHLLFANGPEQSQALIEGLYRSTDGGATWAIMPNTDKVLNVSVGKAAAGANYPSIFIQGEVNGVFGYFMSTDQGNSWTSIGTYPNGIYDYAAVMEGDMTTFGKLYIGFSGNGFLYHEMNTNNNNTVECNDVNTDGICDFSPYIHVDQFGYVEDATKVAVISNPQVGFNASDSYSPSATLELRDASDDGLVFSAAVTAWDNGSTHAQSGDKGWWFDFSNVTNPGEYFIYDPVTKHRSPNFKIGDDVYGEVIKSAMKMFYYNRCNASKVAPYAGSNWTDSISFNNPLQDANCRYVYDQNNASLEKDLTGGWFDAGDYNKYVTFTFGTLHNLLWAYEENPDIFGDDWNIPESGNGIPDILDEIKWELDWLLKMTNPDGSVHIKMGSISYSDNAAAPPSANTDPRYYGPTCTAASITNAGIFAHAAKVFQGFSSMSSYVNTLETNALNTWNYVLPFLNNNTLETACDDGTIKSGDADWDVDTQKENAVIAAIYLFQLTGQNAHNQYVIDNINDTEAIGSDYWAGGKVPNHDALLLYTTLANNDATLANQITNSITTAASNNWENFYGTNSLDLYRSFMPDYAYHWGSSQSKAYYGILNLQLEKYNINPSSSLAYENKAAEQIHYFHGLNPMGLVYLSNMYDFGGDRCVNEIYHGWFADGSDWDHALNSLYGPAPGFLSGGSNKNFTVTTLSPPYGQPDQKSYLDFNDGFPLNSWEISEPAIYYQAAYVRLLANQVEEISTTTLPVELAYFNVSLNEEKTVRLNWKSTSEVNTAYFEIQKSNNKQGFETLARVQAKGGPNSPADYLAYDKNPFKGYSYYRIKQVDLDGSYSYFPIRSVFIEDRSLQIKLQPNPAADQVQVIIEAKTRNLSSVEIMTANGKQVYLKENIDIRRGENQLNIPLDDFPEGIYLVKMNNLDTGEFIVKKLVKR